MRAIEEISRFWYERGLTKDIESIKFFLIYIIETQDINWDELKRILEKSKIDGGKNMETLAQRLREEGIKIGEERGMKKRAEEAARKLLMMGIEIEKISVATGLKEEEIKKLK